MYTFIKYNGGWWLKISNIEEYYNAKIFENKTWMEAAEQLGNPNYGTVNPFTNNLASLIYNFRCPRNRTGILEETSSLIEEISSAQLKYLAQYGSIYINAAGGYCFGIKEDEQVKRKELVYPDENYMKVDIKKFPYGSHYYLYINGRPIYDDLGNTKWNTYERAREIADAYIEKANEKKG